VQLDSRGSVLSTSKKFGLHRLLIGEDYDIFVGFAFHQYCENTELHLDIAQDFLLNSLGISMHESTVCRYLNSAGFSSHQARTKKGGFTFSFDMLVAEAKNWLVSFREDYRSVYDPNDMYSMDFTYTSFGTQQQTSMSPNAFSPPKSERKISEYTSCICDVYSPNPNWKHECMLFTHNKRFDFNGKYGNELIEILKDYSVSLDRLVYVPGTKKYKREHKDMLSTFFSRQAVPNDSLMLTDNGNIFFEKKESVLLDLGWQSHVTYPACVHQFLSPNDNNIHGRCKQQLKGERPNYKEDVTTVLRFMEILDSVPKRDVRDLFNNNLFLDRRVDIFDEKVGSLIRDLSDKMREKQSYYDNCKRKYLKWAVLASTKEGKQLKLNEKSLDGTYWEKK
jgi:hypothetical protein